MKQNTNISYKVDGVSLRCFNDQKAFIEYSSDIDDLYNNIQDYNPRKRRRALIVFDDMNANMISNKKPHPTVTELFTTRRKLIFSPVFLLSQNLHY